MAPEQTAPLRVRMEAGRVGGEKQNLSLEGKTRERLKCLPLVGNDHYGQGRERKMLTRGGPLMEAATVSERCSLTASAPGSVALFVLLSALPLGAQVRHTMFPPVRGTHEL